MKDLQIGDYIDTHNDQGEPLHAQILYIPLGPGQPWIIKDQHGRKWRLWTQGPFTKSFTQQR